MNKFEVFHPFPYGYNRESGLRVVCNMSHMPAILKMKFWQSDSAGEPMDLIYNLSRALLDNGATLGVQQRGEAEYLCLEYEYESKSGLHLGYSVDFGEIGDELQELELLVQVLRYIQEELEPMKKQVTCTCGYCGNTYQASRVRVLRNKHVCNECLKTVCPICGEKKEDFVFTPYGSYSRICRDCFSKSPDGYFLCDSCEEKPYCKGKLVKAIELCNIDEGPFCVQVLEEKKGLRQCLLCGEVDKIENFASSMCLECIKGRPLPKRKN